MKYKIALILFVFGFTLMSTSCNDKVDFKDIIKRLKDKDSKKFDCPQLQMNYNDDCVTRAGKMGKVDQNCDCKPVRNNQYDCPQLQKNFRDDCVTSDGKNGKIDRNCDCKPANNNQYDCPDLQKNFRDPCQTPNGGQGFINRDCECQGRGGQ